jgi:hypothetical protein
MQTRGLVARIPAPAGFLYRAGEEAGSFIDTLSSTYISALKERADWLISIVQPMSDEELSRLVQSRMDAWEPEFQAGQAQVS